MTDARLRVARGMSEKAWGDRVAGATQNCSGSVGRSTVWPSSGAAVGALSEATSTIHCHEWRLDAPNVDLDLDPPNHRPLCCVTAGRCVRLSDYCSKHLTQICGRSTMFHHRFITIPSESAENMRFIIGASLT